MQLCIAVSGKWKQASATAKLSSLKYSFLEFGCYDTVFHIHSKNWSLSFHAKKLVILLWQVYDGMYPN